MPTINVTIPRPLDWQNRVREEAARFNVVCIGRRAGKTTLGQILLTSPETLTYPQAWFSPTYKDMLEVWRELVEILRPLVKRLSQSEKRIELITGGVVEFWSLDNPNSGRGRKYKRVIIDEAAFVSDLMNKWNMAIFPTLVDYQGDAWIFSTPKGHNGFWQLYNQALSHENWQSWQMPSTVNPMLSDADIKAMKNTMPERIFQQEIQAAFLDDAGGVFRNVMGCVSDCWQDEPKKDAQYIASVDVASQVDFTVVTVFDVKEQTVVYIDRFNRVEYPVLESRLEAIYRRFDLSTMIVETNSIGRPVIDHMRAKSLYIQDFTTTNATKAEAIHMLQAGFEHGRITIPNHDILIAELQAFEGQQMASGWRYSAPDGMHDDTVMSLAIGWRAVARVQPAFL